MAGGCVRLGATTGMAWRREMMAVAHEGSDRAVEGVKRKGERAVGEVDGCGGWLGLRRRFRRRGRMGERQGERKAGG